MLRIILTVLSLLVGFLLATPLRTESEARGGACAAIFVDATVAARCAATVRLR